MLSKHLDEKLNYIETFLKQLQYHMSFTKKLLNKFF